MDNTVLSRTKLIHTLLILLLASLFSVGALAKIDPELETRIKAGEHLPVIVEFYVAVQPPLQDRAADLARHATDIASQRDQLLQALPIPYADISWQYQQLPLFGLKSVSPALLDALLLNPLVTAVYEDLKILPHVIESVPLVGGDKLQAVGVGGANTAVVVLDTGVNYTRSEFGNCTGPGTPASCRVPVAFDTAPNDSQLDDNGHGTNVSAIVATVADKTSIIGIDVFNGTSASSSDVIAGIDWAIANRATYNIRAINMSIGAGTKKTSLCSNGNPFQTPINTAHGDGIAVVASAGNSAFIDGLEIPACSANAVSVGATYDQSSSGWNWGICTDAPATVDTVTCFSNSASFLSLLAPGAIITAGGSQKGGTSQAAPHVSGAMAILAGLYPTETPVDWLARLKNTGVSITDTRNGITKPRINIFAAANISERNAVEEEIPFLPPWASVLLMGLIVQQYRRRRTCTGSSGPTNRPSGSSLPTILDTP
jgi:subtilisin family serine protease